MSYDQRKPNATIIWLDHPVKLSRVCEVKVLGVAADAPSEVISEWLDRSVKEKEKRVAA